MAAPRVAVVGAGLAGLAAALELKTGGAEVDIFERSRLLGGRATSFELDGEEVDNGQHVFLACCTEFIRFVERVGMGDRLHLQDRFDVLVFGRGTRSRLRAAALPAPWHLALSFSGYRHLGWRERIGIARALLGIRSAANSRETFAEWLRGHGQSPRALRAFWEPFVVPALNAPLDRVSAADAAFVLSTAFLSNANAARFGWSTVPLARIAEAAAERLDRVHRSTAVVGLQAGSEGIRLRTAEGADVAYDGVVLALSPAQLARLVPEPQRFGIPSLAGYEARAIIDIHLWHDRGPLDFEFAALLDSPVQWIFQKARDYLCCSVSAADEFLRLSTDALIARAWAEVCAAVPALAGARLLRSAVTRNPQATFLPQAGVARPGSATRSPNVALAGSWIATGWPDTMESAVRSGLAAAAALVPSRG